MSGQQQQQQPPGASQNAALPSSAVLFSALQTLHHDAPAPTADGAMDVDDGAFYGLAQSMPPLHSAPTPPQPAPAAAQVPPSPGTGAPEDALGADDGAPAPATSAGPHAAVVAAVVVSGPPPPLVHLDGQSGVGAGDNTSSYGQLVGNGMLAVDAYDSADMVDLDGFLLEDFERNLDFIRFVEQWYYRASLPAGGYPSISDGVLGVRGWRRPAQVTAAELDGDRYDAQGVDWTSVGVMRETARHVRRKLYHNYTNILPRPVGLPPVCPLSDTANFFRFRRLNTRDRVHLSHFQLRNLMCAASRSDVYYAGKTHIFAADPGSNATRMVMDLTKPKIESLYPGGWKTSTLTAGHGVLVVGGFGGEYALASLDAEWGRRHAEGLVTGDDNGITNHVHTYLDRHSAHARAVFCSNDRKIRVLDCATEAFVKEHEYDWPVNCAATSPDGRLRCVVGDDTAVTIGDAETGRPLQQLHGHLDYGFACAWSDDGLHVATGNQDKQVRVYDARYWARPLAVVYTEMAGARALRYSPVGGGKRVLLVAEPADLLHLVDAQLYRSKQRLDQFGEIAGVSFAPDGGEFFAANADEKLGGIMEYERRGHGRGPARPAADDHHLDEPWDWADDDGLERDGRVGRNASWRARRAAGLERIVV
ncbi:MAG: hypothetical protein M1832_004139 [Thelocarpon impressellum]|nr:MAG: hypothetical protein M1832_004139 [Thelocarpon impressellum]